MARGRPPCAPKRRKRRRLGETSIPAERRTAQLPDHVWALDFQFDTTLNGRTTKLLNIIDELTHKSLAIIVDHSIDADATMTALEKTVIDRGRAPEFIRCDNGPELTAHALVDWCKTPARAHTTSIRARPGRTPESNRSTRSSATSASPSRSSTASSKPRSSSPTAATTTTTVHTPRSACSPRPSSQHDNHNPHSQRTRTNNRG